MTILEEQFMKMVASQLRAIHEALTENNARLVDVSPCEYVNPCCVSSTETKEVENGWGGKVTLRMSNGDEIETIFKTADEAAKALGFKTE